MSLPPVIIDHLEPADGKLRLCYCEPAARWFDYDAAPVKLPDIDSAATLTELVMLNVAIRVGKAQTALLERMPILADEVFRSPHNGYWKHWWTLDLAGVDMETKTPVYNVTVKMELYRMVWVSSVVGPGGYVYPVKDPKWEPSRLLWIESVVYERITLEQLVQKLWETLIRLTPEYREDEATVVLGDAERLKRRLDWKLRFP